MGTSMLYIYLVLLGGSLVACHREGGWSGCSATCQTAGETVYRYRINHCDNPNNGDCIEKQPDMFPCNLPKCPVNAAWGGWTAWTACTQTCGQGVRRKTRRCNNPVPSAGGHYCEGHHEMLEHCNNTQKCTVPIYWTSWTYWTKCEECKHGAKRVRRRSCSPLSACGEAYKDGYKYDTKNCTYNTAECPVDGFWRPWGEWSQCTVSCTKNTTNGHGTVTRHRKCKEPERGGKPCDKRPKSETEACSGTYLCPVDCKWQAWGAWSFSPVLGNDTRTRQTEGPFHGGSDCTGEDTEQREAKDSSDEGSGSGSKGDDDTSSGSGSGTDQDNENLVDCKWQAWGAWSFSAVLRKDTRTRQTEGPFHGGSDCTGEDTDQREVKDSTGEGSGSGQDDGSKGDDDTSSERGSGTDQDNENGDEDRSRRDSGSTDDDGREDEEGNPSGNGG